MRADHFPFDLEFQRKIIKLALTEDGFCSTALKYLRAEMFDEEILAWMWRQIERQRQEKKTPTFLVMRDLARRKEPQVRPRYEAMIEAINQELLKEELYIREALGEFVRRNLFSAAYYDAQIIFNQGRADQAIDLMREQVELIHHIRFDAPERMWFYEDLEERQRQRRHMVDYEFDHLFPTGIVGVDTVLDGGLSRGELGVWMADAKGGKSLFLVHLAGFAARALQRRVLFILLEGSLQQTTNRLDAWHARSLYAEVKRGIFDRQIFERLQSEYRTLKQRLVIRAMTDKWNYNVGDIRAELDDLKSQYGWRPELIVCDYGDLLRSQTKTSSEEEHQRNAFSDLKALTAQDQGYGIWSASQARRPENPYSKKKREKKDVDAEEACKFVFGKPVLLPRDIADSYNKIRRADFIGSINQDPEDKERNEARLYCAMYRDNEADRLVRIRQDRARMIFVDVLDPLNRADMPEKVLKRLNKQQQDAAQPQGAQLAYEGGSGA